MNTFIGAAAILLTKEVIDAAFDAAKHQQDWLLAIYRVAFPRWDDIDGTIDGWPSVSGATWRYICGKSVEFDRKHHPDVMAGGMWLNNGFGQGPVPDWTIDASSCKVSYKEAP